MGLKGTGLLRIFLAQYGVQASKWQKEVALLHFKLKGRHPEDELDQLFTLAAGSNTKGLDYPEFIENLTTMILNKMPEQAQENFLKVLKKDRAIQEVSGLDMPPKTWQFIRQDAIDAFKGVKSGAGVKAVHLGEAPVWEEPRYSWGMNPSGTYPAPTANPGSYQLPIPQAPAVALPAAPPASEFSSQVQKEASEAQRELLALVKETRAQTQAQMQKAKALNDETKANLKNSEERQGRMADRALEAANKAAESAGIARGIGEARSQEKPQKQQVNRNKPKRSKETTGSNARDRLHDDQKRPVTAGPVPGPSSASRPYREPSSQQVLPPPRVWNPARFQDDQPRVFLFRPNSAGFDQAARDCRNQPLNYLPQVKRKSFPAGQPLPHRVIDGKLTPNTPAVDFAVYRRRNSPSSSLTREILDWATRFCFRCGSAECGADDDRCLLTIAKAADSWVFCTKCLRGFHIQRDCPWGKRPEDIKPT